jgi:hypothetical protein
MYKSLPKIEKTFEIEVEGETTGIKYEGKFTSKCVLSLADKQSLELEKSRLTADYANPSGKLYAMATMVSSLRARLVEFPEWWKEVGNGSDLLDENVLVDIFDKCEDLALEWKNDLKKASGKEEKEKSGNSKKESGKSTP